eukprot:3140995-Pleurochrysis_carterae.AAC.11
MAWAIGETIGGHTALPSCRQRRNKEDYLRVPSEKEREDERESGEKERAREGKGEERERIKRGGESE